MLCLSGTDGEILWEVDENVPIFEPTFGDEKIFVGNRCYSLDGEILWKGEKKIFGGDSGESTCFYDGKVYICGTWSSVLRCLNAETGEQIWSTYKKDPSDRITFYSSPVAGFGRVFIAGKDNTYCLDHVNGNKIWIAPFGTSEKPDRFGRQETRGGGIAISDSVVVLSGGRGTACMDIDSGEILWESDVKGCLPVIVGDKHVWTAIGGTLSCLSLSDGSTIIQKEYEKKRGDRAYSQVAVAKGKVFVSNCWQGRLHCFEMEE
ncbi:MAG: PQQ-binding-like beta-propeller repeat protein [Caldisericia bacterium]